MKSEELDAPEITKKVLFSMPSNVNIQLVSNLERSIKASLRKSFFLDECLKDFFQLPNLKNEILWGRNGSCVPLR